MNIVRVEIANTTDGSASDQPIIPPPGAASGLEILIKSSMRMTVIAASVAKRSCFTLLIAGSSTPADRLSRTYEQKRKTRGSPTNMHIFQVAENEFSPPIKDDSKTHM